MDTHNAQLDKPKHIIDRQTNAKDADLKDRLVDFIFGLPPELQAYIRTRLMEGPEEETAGLPPEISMPPLPAARPSFTPPPIA